jgi:hypothetical protein
MRAQIFYITGINALEGPASHYFVRYVTRQGLNVINLDCPAPRLPHASIAFITDPQAAAARQVAARLAGPAGADRPAV